MKKPINEIERLKLIAGLINEVDYSESVFGIKSTKQSLTESNTKEAKADEAVKAEVKAKKVTPKAPKELHIDQANPYEYRHGLQYELGVDSDYSDESLSAAKAKVLKNLAKDSNYYSTLLNQKQSHYEFKAPETDAPGMQANADGTLKKGAGKLEKANVKDNLGKKEAGKTKPKGVKIMPDKGVTGSTKTIKEGLDLAGNLKVGDKLKKINTSAPGTVTIKKIEGDKVFIEDEDIKGREFQWSAKGIEDEIKAGKLKLTTPVEEGKAKGKNEGSEKSDWTVGEEIIGGKKHYFLYNQETGKRKGMYKSKEEAEQNIEEGKAKGKFYAIFDKARGEEVDVYDTEEEAQAALDKINKEDPHHGDYVIDDNTPKDKHSKIKEALKSALKKEGIYRNSKGEAIIATSTQSDAELRKRGYTLVPGTIDATGVKK